MDSNVAKTKLIVTLTCSVVLFAPAAALPKADRVVVVKHERKLTLMHAGKPLKTYSVALGTEPTGANREIEQIKVTIRLVFATFESIRTMPAARLAAVSSFF